MLILLLAGLSALPSLDTMAKAKLHAGRVLVESTQDGPERGQSRALGWSKLAPGPLWRVITDHASFPQFMPHLKSAQVTGRTDKGERAALEVDAVISKARYTLDFTFDQDALRVEFALDKAAPHDIADAQGHWQLWPFQGGTLIEYVSAVDLGRSVPGFIRSYLAERGAEDAVDSVRKRAESLAAPGKN